MFSIGRWTTVQMLITLKLTHRFSAVPINIPKVFPSLQLDSKFITEEQRPKPAKTFMKRLAPSDAMISLDSVIYTSASMNKQNLETN